MDSLKGADFEIVFEKTLTYAKAREYFCLIKNLHSLNNQNYNQTILCIESHFCKIMAVLSKTIACLKKINLCNKLRYNGTYILFAMII